MNRGTAAEAAVWVARLHGPDRSPAMEREFRAWLDTSDAHRLAFERCTDVWEAVPRLSVADAYGTGPRPRTTAWRWAAAALALLVAAGLHLWPVDDTYATAVGEYRKIVLADGSRLHLNTATQLTVVLKKERREVHVRDGEALFEVAKDPHRPFIVHAGGHEVRALGTMFSIRLTPLAPDALSVTLIEGSVEVAPNLPTRPVPSPVRLEPGQRLQVSGAAGALHLDRPSVASATAWARSEVALDDVSLFEAVAEVNRYGSKPIVLADDPAVRAVRVSGVYRAGDSEGFAMAVAALHGLEVRLGRDHLLIQQGQAAAAGSSGEDPRRARQ